MANANYGMCDRTPNTQYIPVDNAQSCSTYCTSNPNCSQWSFSTSTGRPICAVDNTPPPVLYTDRGAVGGQIYVLQSSQHQQPPAQY